LVVVEEEEEEEVVVEEELLGPEADTIPKSRSGAWTAYRRRGDSADRRGVLRVPLSFPISFSFSFSASSPP